MKKILKKLIPPLLLDAFRLLKSENKVKGSYQSWGEAKTHATGYDSDAIFESIKKSALLCKDNTNFYDRDGALFSDNQKNKNFIHATFLTFFSKKSKIKVLDFGGALGSLYYQHRQITENAIESWTVIEQAHYVDFGKQRLVDDVLHFKLLDELSEESDTSDLLILSSVLQYLEEWELVVKKLISLSPRFIFLDRTPFMPDSEKIQIQVVKTSYFKGSLPIRIMSEKDLIKFFNSHGYDVVDTWKSMDDIKAQGFFGGMIFKRTTNE